MLLPEFSPFQTLETVDDEIHATFAGKVLKFPSDETWVLPIANVTVEELSHLLLNELLAAENDEDLVEVELTVSSGSGQAGSAIWTAEYKNKKISHFFELFDLARFLLIIQQMALQRGQREGNV